MVDYVRKFCTYISVSMTAKVHNQSYIPRIWCTAYSCTSVLNYETTDLKLSISFNLRFIEISVESEIMEIPITFLKFQYKTLCVKETFIDTYVDTFNYMRQYTIIII